MNIHEMLKQKMGFEKKRPAKEYNNERVTAEVGGKEFNFRSKLEYMWAQYCQFRKEQGLIKDWAYEQTTFIFKEEIKGAKMFLVDFDILNTDGTFHYEECKGHLEPRDYTKYERLKKYRPEVVLDLVMQRIPNPTTNAGRRLARIDRLGLVRRVINANTIFRQIKGII